MIAGREDDRGVTMRTIQQLDQRYYSDYVDEHARFDRTVRRYLRPDAVVLDAGAGRGRQYPYDYRELVTRVVGVDATDDVMQNRNVDEAIVADLVSLPFEDGAFDLVFSKYVLEHLTDPGAAFRELRRVSKVGGHLVFHAPNRFHYYSIAAKLTPHRFHVWFNEKRGQVEEDTFETVYRANDRFALRRIATASRYRVVRLDLFETKPAYLFFHPIAYRAGIAYERTVNRFDSLKDLRCNIIGVFEAV
jgi:SAM-dependent methyltransferase